MYIYLYTKKLSIHIVSFFNATGAKVVTNDTSGNDVEGNGDNQDEERDKNCDPKLQV